MTQVGGFSPGVAARLRLVDGRRVFVKAVGPEPNPDGPAAHRAEARNMALLPRSAPAPRLLWSLDRRGWVALAFEDVDGAQPTLPWRPGQLRRVLEMVAAMAAALTPAPAGFPPIGERLQDSFVGWRRLAAAHAAGDDLAGLDPWAARHLDRLADLEAGWPRASRGRDPAPLRPAGRQPAPHPDPGGGRRLAVGVCRGGLGRPAPAAPQRDHAGRPRPGGHLRHPPRRPPAPTRGRSPPPWPPGPASWSAAPACRPRPGSPPSGPFSSGRAWSPSTGCGGGPAGPDRPSAGDLGIG